jgi:glycolate oxidase
VLSTALRQLKPFKLSEDIAVPRSKIAETIAHFKEIGVRMGLTIATYGHAGDGNLHANILFERPDQRPIVEEAIEQILRFTVGLGGTITGEHGVGFSKRAYLPMEQPLELIELQRRLKDFFDPSGILNPGKIFLP